MRVNSQTNIRKYLQKTYLCRDTTRKNQCIWQKNRAIITGSNRRTWISRCGRRSLRWVGSILNTAGIDAHGKGFGVDALNADNHSWVLSRMAVEFDCQPTQYTDYTDGHVDQRLRPGALDAKLHADRCRGPRIRPRRDAVGDDRPAEPFGDRPLVGGRRACRRHRRCRAPDGQAAQDPRGEPYRDGRTPRGLQRHRLQPPRQHDALYRNDARHAARRHADAGGSGAAATSIS